MNNEKTYLVSSNINLEKNFLSKADSFLGKYEIEDFAVFQDTEDTIKYKSNNNTYFRNEKEISFKEFEEAVKYCEKNMFGCTGTRRKTRYIINIKSNIYNLDVFKEGIEGLILLKTENELTEEMKKIIIRDVTNEKIYKNMTSGF